MREWLQCFFEDADAVLTLNGKIINKQQYREVGCGSQKRVYKLNDEGLCFFIPNKWSTEKAWVNLITREKALLDQIIKLGLKAQQFEITDLTITNKAGKSFTIKVLLTKDFETLAKEESIVIHNGKGNVKVTGTRPPFYGFKDRFKDPVAVQQMLKKIINEYAMAMTFSLPISPIHNLDDSEHFYFELPPTDSKELPIARYMFWDVERDFEGIELPDVPTLEQLKSGKQNHRLFLRPIDTFADSVKSAIVDIAYDEISKAGGYDYEFPLETLRNIKSALRDDHFLNNALAFARQTAVNFLNEQLEQKELKTIILQEKARFINFILSAISTSNLDLVKKIITLHPTPAAFIKEHLKTIHEKAVQYGHQPIIDYLSHTLPIRDPAYDKMIQTIEVLQTYVRKQTARLSPHINDFFNKGIADKNRLFKLVNAQLTKMQLEITDPNADFSALNKKIAQYTQDIEKCIADCGIIAHHHRRSKLDKCANFFRACLPKIESIVPTSWKEWQQLTASWQQDDPFYRAYSHSLNENNRPKNNYNNYRHRTLRI